MPQNKKLDELLGQYWDIAHSEGATGVSRGDEAGVVLSALQGLLDQPDVEPAVIDLEAVQQLARKTYRQHKHSIKGQMIAEADSFENHLIWATAKLFTHPTPFTPITADMVTDEMAIDYFKDYPYMKFEPDSLICAKRCIAAAVNAYMGAKK
jgi:hypothetical protein